MRALVYWFAGVACGALLSAQAPETLLPRTNPAGTAFDPNQPLVPYVLRRASAASPRAAGLDTPAALVESPPEYAPARGVLFRFTTGYAGVVPACVAALTGDAAHDEIAYVVVNSSAAIAAAQANLLAAGADLAKVEFLIEPTDSVWLRDYGPHFVFENDTLAIVDSHYYPSRPLDNFVPTLTAQQWQMPSYPIGLYYSGGNFQPGPNRSGFASALINNDNPAAEGFDAALIAELYQRYQGIDTLHVLPQLPSSVDGTGHIDMWMYLVDEHSVILSQFLPGSNPTAISITDNAVPYMQSLGFAVHRPPAWNVGGTHYTYTNAFRVNDRIFVPVYGTQLAPGGNPNYDDEDASAMAIWQAAAGPSVQLVPINCYAIIPSAGAIHCIVMQVPRYTAAQPAVALLAPRGGDLLPAGEPTEIRWQASDHDNAALQSAELYWSADDGQHWQPIGSGADDGVEIWTAPDVASAQARVKVVVHSASGATATAISSAPFAIQPGSLLSYDLASGAGGDKTCYGYQVANWAAADQIQRPAPTPMPASYYAPMAASDATGGDSDPNRYISPAIGAGQRCLHTLEFAIGPAPSAIDQLEIDWEGYADQCSQLELYLWDWNAGQWGDGSGLLGQNRYAANYAGNADAVLHALVRSDLQRWLGPQGKLVMLLYVERSSDEVYLDYGRVRAFSRFAGLANFGSGTPGCAGAHSLSAHAPPALGSSFELLAGGAPAFGHGVLALAGAADPSGSDPLGLGLWLHLDLGSLASVQGLSAGASGQSSVGLAIPADPSLAGASVFAQAVWAWPAGPCLPSIAGLSSSPGLEITLQP